MTVVIPVMVLVVALTKVGSWAEEWCSLWRCGDGVSNDSGDTCDGVGGVTDQGG